MPRPGKKTSPPAIDRVKRQAKALEMREAGFTHQQIADHFGVSKTTAYRYITDALDDLIAEPAMNVLKYELARLDTMQLALRGRALKGDDKAISASLRIMERRAKYMNLDGAVQHDVSAEARAELESLNDNLLAAAKDIIAESGDA